MKIGVTTQIQFSLFSGGTGGTSLAIAEVFKNLGHEVWLLNTNPEVSWWEDCKTLLPTWEKSICPMDKASGFDLVIEVGSTQFASAAARAAVAKKCVWLVRKSAVLKDIELSLYPIHGQKRCVDGLNAIWAFDKVCSLDDLQYLELTGRCPAYHVPFVWSPTPIEVYRTETKAPEWIQITDQYGADKPWHVHVCETNNTCASSSTLPLVILKDAKQRCGFNMKKWTCHNAEHINKNDFFKNNVLNHCQATDLSGVFLGRQRVIDWVYDPKSCLLSHVRFTPIRPFQLEAAWTGIPMVHNSLFLRDIIGDDYSQYYYPDNDVIRASESLANLDSDYKAKKGIFDLAVRNKLRQALIATVTPFNQTICAAYAAALSRVPEVTSKTSVAAVETKKHLIVFSDMWDDFQADYNVFIVMMNEAGRHLKTPVRFEGIGFADYKAGMEVDLCIFGPFGQNWKTIASSVPKVHYTGENSQMFKSPDIVMNMGYQHADFVDQDYLRLPLWMLEIDWFGVDKERIVNPKPIPIDRCTTVSMEDLSRKKKFCAFVVTNPCNPVRNDAFKTLTQYKHVDSAGRLFNNVGDVIFAGLGGGGGEVKKFEFLRDYKFCIAYENSSSQGYTTEKYLHAKAAGCIPIYWGDPKIERDFDSAGFIDARNFTRPEQLIEAVKAVDTSTSEWLKMYSVPALDETRRDVVRRTLSECSRRLLKIALKSEEGLSAIPRFLGGATDAEAATFAAARADAKPVVKAVVPSPATVLPTPVKASPSSSKEATALVTSPTTRTTISSITVATCATKRFLPSLSQWMASMNVQKQNVQIDLKAHVWLGGDVDAAVEQEIKKTYAWIQLHRFPAVTVEGFPDFWEPQHFAWKLFILRELAISSKDELVFYMDSGVFMCRWPVDYLLIAKEKGICLLNDERETNGRWCHEVFCKHMKVTETEKQATQIWAGAVAFMTGQPDVIAMFTEALIHAKTRAVIVGPKWAGVGTDGKPFGHRHDQSLLSILSERTKMCRYPMDLIYCSDSLRRTFMTKKSLYVHRGEFSVHTQFTEGIDDCYVINLDRRADRMETLYKNSPNLAGRIERFSAVEGRKLTLTPAIARLFRPHDFKWKKAVMGCALSHLGLWNQLANEREEIDRYLILEDDVKLSPEWEARWNAALPSLPADFDIIYLGGILPPNRAGFEQVKQRVNQHFSRVAENSCFGQNPPNRYFHWCAYAYVLSKKGAKKVLEILKARDGYWTSADHMLCNPVEVMSMYFLDPLVAGCYQDDDPRYQNSAFNDFSRVDGFDSDLWNNKESFLEAEANAAAAVTAPLSIEQALVDAREHCIGSESVEVSKKELITEMNPMWTRLASATSPEAARDVAFELLEGWNESWWTRSDLSVFLDAFKCKTFAGLPSKDKLRFLLDKWQMMYPTAPAGTPDVSGFIRGFLEYTPSLPQVYAKKGRRVLSVPGTNLEHLYEATWLQELVGPNQSLSLEGIDFSAEAPGDQPIVLIARPHMEQWHRMLKRWSDSGSKFYVIHLSDELAKDSLEIYGLSGCLGIVRTYCRPNLEPYMSKVVIIPLGYHWTKGTGIDEPELRTPRLPFRELNWSFYGTNWNGREESMKNLSLIPNHSLRWYKEWNDPTNLGKEEYLSQLMNSRFVPTPGGVNPETYRFYEALECGCIPVYVRQPGDEMLFTSVYTRWFPIANLATWDHAAALMYQLLQDPPLMERYRSTLLQGYVRWKRELCSHVRKILALE